MYMHTDLYFGHMEQLFLVVPTKGHSFVQCPKGSVCNEGCPFVLRNMYLSHKNFRYKGAPPFSKWRPMEIVVYFLCLGTFLLIGYIFN